MPSSRNRGALAAKAGQLGCPRTLLSRRNRAESAFFHLFETLTKPRQRDVQLVAFILRRGVRDRRRLVAGRLAAEVNGFGWRKLVRCVGRRGGRFRRRRRARRARLGFPRRFLELDANFLSRSPHYPGVALGSRHAHDECIRQNGGALNHEPGAPVGNIQNLAENRGREFSGVHPNVPIRLLTGCLPLFLDGPISGKAYAPGACHDNLRRSLGVSRVAKTWTETFAVLLIGFDNSMHG